MTEDQTKFRILFVCEGNTCRSQMAEGYFRSLGDERLEIYSSGVNTSASKVNANAIAAMNELKIDITSQRPKPLRALPRVSFDLVIFLCKKPEENLPIPGLPLYIHWMIDDPLTCGGKDCTNSDYSEKALVYYREARDKIKELVTQFIERGNLDTLISKKNQYQALLDSLEEGVIVHDDKRIIYLFNKAAEEITGYSREDLVGMDCHSIFSSGGICGSNCSFCSKDLTEKAIIGKTEHEVNFVTKDGEKRRLKMVVSPSTIGHTNAKAVTAVMRNMTEVSDLRRKVRKKFSFHGIVGRSHKMREIFETINQISTSNYPVLITGESGTGKELTAGAIHNESRQSGGPFVPINCGALPEHILESELFGHVRGAFTGAVRDKKGRFELAHKGTLFLDEVGELTPSFQVKLLRVLQEKSFEKVGGEKTVKVDVRIIAATNQNLKQMIKENKFREDLFYRLCVVPIHLPPLRDRREDIPEIVEQVLADVREESGKNITGVSDEAMNLIMSYRWPGNIRQLINVLQFASIRCPQELIQANYLPPEITSGSSGFEPTSDIGVRAADLPAPEGRTKLSADTVSSALQAAGGNKVKAAKLLGVGRATLYRFLEKNPI